MRRRSCSGCTGWRSMRRTPWRSWWRRIRRLQASGDYTAVLQIEQNNQRLAGLSDTLGDVMARMQVVSGVLSQADTELANLGTTAWDAVASWQTFGGTSEHRLPTKRGGGRTTGAGDDDDPEQCAEWAGGDCAALQRCRAARRRSTGFAAPMGNWSA